MHESVILVGRESERAKIAALLDSVRRGISEVMVVAGEAGVGKSTLVAHAAAQADDFTIIRFDAVQSEMHLGFAALHALLTPLLHRIEELPIPQKRALNAVFGVSDDDAAPDPFVVGLAALTLLSAEASERSLLIVVDDAQWLDQESAKVIAFVARRLYADQIGMLIATRSTAAPDESFDGLARLEIGPLTEAASRDLLGATSPTRLSPFVEDQIVAEANGNPLALLELARDLSWDQRAGVSVLPEPFHVDRRIEDRFLRQVRRLPLDAQRLLLAVAAEPTGDTGLVLSAGERLGFDADSIQGPLEADLLIVGPTFGFRHSLIRSAVYQGATDAERRRTHAALAAATAVDRDPDRRAWHRAAATAFHDEEVAGELERAARRSQGRGSHAAAAALYERAAELTPERNHQALRLFLAAGAALTAGNAVHAHSTVSRAIPDLDGPLLRVNARRVQAAALFFQILPDADAGRGAGRRDEEIMTTMLDTVEVAAPLDLHLAREIILDALPMAVFFGGLSTHSARSAAEVALSLPLPPDVEPTSTDLVLDALAMQFMHGSSAAAPLLRRCLAKLHADEELKAVPRTMALGCWIGYALGDDEAVRRFAQNLIASSREEGIVSIIPEALNYLGQSEIRLGRLAAADAIYAEQHEIEGLWGSHVVPAVAQLMVAAYRGEEGTVRSSAAALSHHVAELNIGLLFDWVRHSLLILELGLGNYAAAAGIRLADLGGQVAFDPFKAADEIEAHVRFGDPAFAAERLAWLSDRASANQTPLELGLLCRGKALLADDSDAERWYIDSVAHLTTSGAGLHQARTQLLYGEWLRRQQRRSDARLQLETAVALFEEAGANAFAARARIELLATGARARKRIDETRNDLTPQEKQIARFAANGATNAEIASRLFISPKTVEYHLGKVFRKLNLTSRRQLEATMSEER